MSTIPKWFHRFTEKAHSDAMAKLATGKAGLAIMHPNDFLKLAKHTKGCIDKHSRASLDFDLNGGYTAIPYLKYSVSNGIAQVVGHEGRHRTMANLEAGFTEVPVLFELVDIVEKEVSSISKKHRHRKKKNYVTSSVEDVPSLIKEVSKVIGQDERYILPMPELSREYPSTSLANTVSDNPIKSLKNKLRNEASKKEQAQFGPVMMKRELINRDDLNHWAVTNGLPPIYRDGIYVPVGYSEDPINWSNIPDAVNVSGTPGVGDLSVNVSKGQRSLERLPSGEIVLRFEAPNLQRMNTGLNADDLDPNLFSKGPMISLFRDDNGVIDLTNKVPYQGEMTFGPTQIEPYIPVKLAAKPMPEQFNPRDNPNLNRSGNFVGDKQQELPSTLPVGVELPSEAGPLLVIPSPTKVESAAPEAYDGLPINNTVSEALDKHQLLIDRLLRHNKGLLKLAKAEPISEFPATNCATVDDNGDAVKE